jgi:hypothetical protein
VNTDVCLQSVLPNTHNRVILVAAAGHRSPDQRRGAAVKAVAVLAASPRPQISTGLDSATTFEICSRLRALCHLVSVSVPASACGVCGNTPRWLPACVVRHLHAAHASLMGLLCLVVPSCASGYSDGVAAPAHSRGEPRTWPDIY